MKKFLDNGDGRYVSDFPDDELWDHKNAIILPHLGASTEEAEDQAVRTSNIFDDFFWDLKRLTILLFDAFYLEGGHGCGYHSRIFGTRNNS